jgi:hypothetical protein
VTGQDDVTRGFGMNQAGLMGIEKHGRLEIDENFAHHVHSWRVKRISWVVMGLLIVAALAGFLGPGPYSSTTAQGPGGLHLEYDHISRYNAPAHLYLTVPGGKEDLEVSVPTKFIKEIELEHIDPEPKEMRLSGEKHTWIFPRQESSSEVMINYRPQAFGKKQIRLEVKDAGVLEVQQLFIP